MARAWLFQDPRQKQKLGEKCAWSVGWLYEGKRKSKSIGSKSMAQKFARKLEGELSAGIHHAQSRKMWSDFRTEYETKVLARSSAANQKSANIALDHFERLGKPHFVRSITTATIDQYITLRQAEQGAKGESLVSVATINKELRHIKAALRVAREYKHLPDVPKIRMLREQEKIPSYVTPDDFAKIYEACDAATMPAGLPYTAADWWRSLLVFLQLTGWRIGETLALLRSDVDMDAGTALTRADKNKGKRDDRIPLHPVVVDHLRTLASFRPEIFPWVNDRRELWDEFHRIQKSAGIHLPCDGKHKHTDACHRYGFHDLRRAFATLTAETMTGDALQRLMRHRSYSTTQRYVNLAGQVNRAVSNLHVPAVLKTGTTN